MSEAVRAEDTPGGVAPGRAEECAKNRKQQEGRRQPGENRSAFAHIRVGLKDGRNLHRMQEGPRDALHQPHCTAPGQENRQPPSTVSPLQPILQQTCPKR